MNPRGLYTLFFTEMWERLGYYGVRALLMLFMVEAKVRGGLGLSVETAAAVYGLYTSAAYLAALPGGWVADRLLGARRAVWCGGILIAAGYFTLAVPRTEPFFLGLSLVVIGTGLLKPNVSVMVGELYPEGGARRDAGFTVFYMGVNLGAALGPLVCAALQVRFDWHWGFAAAGIGMVLGLVQFALTGRHLGAVGQPPACTQRRTRDWYVVGGALGALVLLVGLGASGRVRIEAVVVARWAAVVILGLAAVYFLAAFCLFGLTPAERKRVLAILVLFLAATLFWAGFEQAGSSFNLFAQEHTQRTVHMPSLGGTGGQAYVVPAGWFQSLGAVFVITLAPVTAAFWLRLARRGVDPSAPAKFGLGLILLGLGFLVMAGAAVLVARGSLAAPWWLAATYLLHSLGELCLSPVGLSSVSKLAPARLVGQMLGIWFLATSFGNLLAGLIAGQFRAETVPLMPGRFGMACLVAAGAGLGLLLLAPHFQRLTQERVKHGVGPRNTLEDCRA